MDEIHRYEGKVDQFMVGMAMLDTPIAREDHARRARYASLSIPKAAWLFTEKLKKECGIGYKMRIGLNSDHSNSAVLI